MRFLQWLAIPPGAAWLDVGCGTGALSQAILDTASPRHVKGIDSSQAYLEYARRRLKDERVSLELGNAQDLAVSPEAYDAAVSGLVLNFVPEPARMIAGMMRAVCRGGTVAVYVWDYAGEMQFMRHFWDAAAALDPVARDLDEGRRFPICDPEALTQAFEAAGLSGVRVIAIDIQTGFKDFEDYWMPFEGGQGPAPVYLRSLTDERRGRLREHLRAALPTAADGSIPLVARAWAARGMKEKM
jgi:trans-aconitate methyltransferase